MLQFSNLFKFFFLICSVIPIKIKSSLSKLLEKKMVSSGIEPGLLVSKGFHIPPLTTCIDIEKKRNLSDWFVGV